MKASLCVVVALCPFVQALGLDLDKNHAAGHLSLESVLTFDAAGAKDRPVTKVINLLKDMLKQLEKEAEEDQEIYDKMACWCETNDKEKSKAIKDAQARITMLQSKIEELIATSARLTTEIANLEKELAEDQAALEKATALRTKELAEFNGEEKDMIESIAALKAAITVLGKHNTLLQVPHSHIMGIAASIQHQMQVHAALLKDILSERQRKTIAAFVQAPEDYFDAAPTFKQAYAPGSGQIFGILKQMLEQFESNMSEGQKNEMKNAKAFADLKAAKELEIAATSNLLDKKKLELATTDQKLAQSREDLEDTTNSLAADEQFLMMLKEKCALTDAEWEERSKTRQLEMEAVSKALAVLSGDDAHDIFTRTFNPSFMQRQAESSVMSSRRTYVSKMLSAMAQKVRDPRLAELAVSARLDAFTRVKKAIDDMVADLLQQKEDEIKLRDFCISGMHDNDMETQEKTQKKEDLEQKISDLELAIKTLADEIKTLEAANAEMMKQLKQAGVDRAAENTEFQMTIADQRATQKLLAQALEYLRGFYAKKSAAALPQTQHQEKKAGQAPPPGFTAYENSAAAGGVMGMIQQIIDDAKRLEKDAIRSEEDAQKAYEDFVKDTNDSIETNHKNIVNKTETKAQAEKDLVETNKSLEATVLELDQLANSLSMMKQKCDFTLKNFDIRQTARDQEVEALKQAKAILSGATFTEFLQTP